MPSSDLDALEQAARAAQGYVPGDPTTVDGAVAAMETFRALASPDVILRLIAAVREADALREAALKVIQQAETDDDGDGQFIDYLVPFEAVDALRAALSSTEPAQ